jgi:hypothetical protein
LLGVNLAAHISAVILRKAEARRGQSPECAARPLKDDGRVKGSFSRQRHRWRCLQSVKQQPQNMIKMRLKLERTFHANMVLSPPRRQYQTGTGMFVLRSLFWLATVVVLLPASSDGHHPGPRVSLVHTAYAARVLLQDVTGVCERHPEACETSREALELLTRKLETGAGIVSAGITASQALSDPSSNHGTLTAADLEPAWSLARVLQ